MNKPEIINVVVLMKGKSVRRFVFYREEYGISVSIQVNSDFMEIYSVSEEFANREIIDLVHKGYKVL